MGLDVNGFSKEHVKAIEARDSAAEVLKKEQGDVAKCRIKEATTNEHFCKFDNWAKGYRSDWIDKTNKADTAEKNITSIDEQLKTTTNSNMESALKSRKTELTNQVAKLRAEAKEAKQKYDWNKQKASEKQKELESIKMYDLPKENTDVKTAQKKWDEADAKVKVEEQKDIERARKKAEEEKVETKKYIQDYGEGYQSEEIVKHNLSAEEIKQNGADAALVMGRKGQRLDQSNLNKLKAELQKAVKQDNISKQELEECKQLLTSYEKQLINCKDPQEVQHLEDEINSIKSMLISVQDRAGYTGGQVKYYQDMIARTESSISQTEEILGKVREENGMVKTTGNVEPKVYSNVTDVKAAYDAKVSANEDYTNALNAAQTFERNMPSYVTNLGQNEAACNKDISTLQAAMNDKTTPESQKVAIGKQIVKLQNKITEIGNARKELQTNLETLKNNAKVAKQNADLADKAHKLAVEQNQKEQQVLGGQYKDARADRKYQDSTYSQSLSGAMAMDSVDAVSDYSLSRKEDKIRDLQGQLAQIDDKYSAEYADVATQYANELNTYIDEKNDHFTSVGDTQQTIRTTADIGIAAFATATGSPAGAALVIGGGKLALNADAKLAEDGNISTTSAYGKSDKDDLAQHFLLDLAKGYAAGKLGDVLCGTKAKELYGDIGKTVATKLEKFVTKLGGRIPMVMNSKAYKIILDTVSNYGANGVVDALSNPVCAALDGTTQNNLKLLANSVEGATPGQAVLILKTLLKAA